MNDYSGGNSDYTPIDCELYSRYELAIMHRQRLRAAWWDDTGLSHIDVLYPINLHSHNRAEYLLAKNRFGKILELRLDRIIRADPVAATCKAASRK